MEEVEGYTNRKENWTTRATGKPKSVVQTLFNRQLGLPHFSRHGDVAHCVSLRQIFNSRSPSDEKGKPVKAAKVDLKLGNSLYAANKGGSKWTQISIPNVLNMCIIDSKIWVRWKVQNPRQNEDEKAMEAFYLVEPSSAYGLKCIQKVYSCGRGQLTGVNVFATRSLSSEGCTEYFMTLVQPGILRAYNLGKREIMQDLALPLSISPGIEEYTDMAIFDNCKKIFLMGNQKDLTKVIITLDYPPWKEIGILHVDIPVKITIQDGVCFLFNEKEKCVEITTWSLLIKGVEFDRTPKVIIDDPQNIVICASEGRREKMPSIISKVRVQTEYFGVIDMDVPFFFAHVRSGMDFYNFYPDPDPVYEFVSTDEEEPIELFQFPSATCRVLICGHFSGQNQTLGFNSEWNGRKYQKLLKVNPQKEAFKYWETSRANSVSTAVGERRPKRSCANNNKISDVLSSNIQILRIAYCSEMDLLAVLTVDEEEFHVAIYETLKLHPIKALPPVVAWPRVKDRSDVNPKRSSIEGVGFHFEAEFMFVTFRYAATCKPQREVFYIRLLSEIF